MHALWHWILYVLAWASHDPATLESERARAAGCVTVAYAALAVDPPPPPPRRIDRGAVADTPLFDAHRKTCTQCSKPLMNPDGTENSICEDGFALWQQDLRNAKPKSKSNPAATSPRCRECDGTGKIFRPDGGYVRCKCGACPSGTCGKVLP